MGCLDRAVTAQDDDDVDREKEMKGWRGEDYRGVRLEIFGILRASQLAVAKRSTEVQGRRLATTTSPRPKVQTIFPMNTDWAKGEDNGRCLPKSICAIRVGHT